MDFSFVNKPPLKRKEPDSDRATQPAAPSRQSEPSTAAPTSAPKVAAAARPTIQLPSLREVQAAQRPRAPPNLFRPASATQPPTAPGNEGSSAAGAAPAGQPAGVRPATYSLSPAAVAASSQSLAGRGGGAARMPASSLSAGTGVFSPERPPQNAAEQASSSHRPLPASGGQGHQPRATHGAGRPTGQQHSSAVVQTAQFQPINPNAILVNKRQEGNPLLRHIRNVRWQYADIVPDYQLGNSTCALFLSLRFHLLKPEYIHHRIRELQRSFRLRVLLCHVDVEDVVRPLEQVTKAALLNDCTLICAWSPEECARYLETYKSYETKPADSIQGRTDEDYFSRLNAAFTTIRGVNKTDVLTLASTFKTAGGIMQASLEQLAACPGIGPTKTRRLYETFHEPFRKVLPPHSSTGTGSQAAPEAAAQPDDAPGALASQQDGGNAVADALLIEDSNVGDDEGEDDDFGLD